MANRPPSRPLSASSPSSGFSSVSDVVSSSSPSDLVLSGTSAALDALKNVLEAVDTLPCVKYIASVGVKILEIVDVRYFLFLFHPTDETMA